MKATELIARLEQLVEEHGDVEVKVVDGTGPYKPVQRTVPLKDDRGVVIDIRLTPW